MIRERAYDPSFGSIAIVRRAGLDLRNNLKWTSFGHLNVMRVEVMQLLEEAFKILASLSQDTHVRLADVAAALVYKAQGPGTAA